MTNGLRFLSWAALSLGACATVRPPETVAAPPQPAPAAPQLWSGPAAQRTGEALQRVRARNGDLHAVIALSPSAEAEAAEIDASRRTGPLVGMPILIKDNVEVAGMPTTAGSLALAGNATGRDSPLVARLREAGAVILGKTNLSEWANIRSGDSISGWSAVGGQTRNPYALDRNTCGSSSGSGAAVAAGYTDYAIGSETDGSITCPASMNGVVGLKPTLGLVPRTHIVPISHSQDTAGPMTRTVRQAAEMLTVIAGSDPADPPTKEADSHKTDYTAALTPNALKGQRIAVLRFATGFGTNPAFNAAVAALKQAGAEIVEVKELKSAGNYGAAEYQVLLTELKTDLNAYLAGSPAPLSVRTLADTIAFNKAQAAVEMPLFGQDTFEEAEATKGLDDPAYKKARADSLRIASASLDKMLADNKVVALVFPTRPAAWKIDVVNGDVSPGGNAIGSMAAVAGYPHLTVPMGLVRGMPVGLSFVGPRWSEAKLLSLGYAYELVRGEFPRPRFLPSIEQAPEFAPALQPQSLRP